MTFAESLQYLDTFTNYERLVSWPEQRAVRLDRMECLLHLLGDPHRTFRSILVGGTKGKGSVCACLYAVLGEINLPVGLYTSPHLTSVCERIRRQHGGYAVEGQDWITEESLAELVSQWRAAINTVHREPAWGGLTYFEVLTALAFRHFADHGVEWAVVEVGLGGRLDATNVLTPDVTVLTPISYDHVEVLGASLGEIAREKAGIIKPQGAVVVAKQLPEAQAVIDDIVQARSAAARREGPDFLVGEVRVDAQGTRATVAGWFGATQQIQLSLIGAHQAQNAFLAVAALEILRERGLPLTPEAITSGLKRARWPGRFEVMRRSPWVILDGAQNTASAKALAETVRAVFPAARATVILGVSQPKDLAGIIHALAPIADGVIATQAQHPRAYPAADVAQACQAEGLFATPQPTVAAALTSATHGALADTLIIITGSLFVVGEARQLLTTELKHWLAHT